MDAINKQQLISTIRILNDMNMKPNFAELARIYHMDYRTVKKYYENGGMIPQRKKREEYSRWDPYEEEITQKLTVDGATIRGVHEYYREKLSEDELPGSYSSLKAYVKKKGMKQSRGRKNEVHLHFETDPGQQVQVDWIEGMKLKLKSGKTIKFNIYSATLGWSREHIFLYSPTITTYDFIRCTLDMYRKLGGKTKELLTDNMSAVVSVKNGKKTVHPQIEQFFKDLGVKLKLCRVRSPQTKGKCESANRFRSWVLPYDGELDDEEDVRKLIDEVLTRRVNDQMNQTTQLAPSALFKKEKEYLSPLPNKVLLDSYLKERITRIVPQTLLVTYKGSGYSVPNKYLNSRVHLYAIDNQLYIYDSQGVLITTHSISSSHKYNYHLEHYADGLDIPGKTDTQIQKIAADNLRRLDLLVQPDSKVEK